MVTVMDSDGNVSAVYFTKK